MRKSIAVTLLTAGITLTISERMASAEDLSVEVIHHWVSEGEVKALNVIREDLAKKGIKWLDSAVGGLSGANALTALRSRIAANDPPGAMQFLGWEALTWSQEGQLRDITELAKKGNWDAVVPKAMQPFLKDGDKWIAVPINMHRVNWIWGNPKLFKDAGLETPKTWDELIAVGEKFKQKGIIPVALSDESWQLTQTFQSMMTDLYGPKFYTKAAVELDEAALRGPEMIGTFDMLRKLRGLADDNFSNRDWAVATGMVINGQAAMQIMGDWAKGEFLAKGLKPGADFLCFPTPGKATSYNFVSDTFGTFKSDDADRNKAQDALLESSMDPAVQKGFNLFKGSIPARTDVDMADFDDCAKQAVKDRAAAVANGGLVGSLTDSFAAKPEFASVFMDVIGQFFVNNEMTSQQAVDLLVQGINNAK